MNTQVTRDYSKFHTLPGNRPISDFHVKKLVKSMGRRNLLETHPIHYIVADSLFLADVQMLNGVAKTWTLLDYIESYVALGKPDYITLLEFLKKEHLTPSVAAMFLSNRASGGDRGKQLRSGTFKVHSLEYAKELVAIQSMFTGFAYNSVIGTQRFADCVISMRKIPGFSILRMQDKLQHAGVKIIYGTRKEMMRQLEDVYNWHAQKIVRFI